MPSRCCPSGSSPRVRGTHLLAPSLPRCGRFIPACAGNAGPSRPSCSRRPVHPRVCGERIGGGDATGAGGRFIPACAGNARAARASPSGWTVHPRVCGERLAGYPMVGMNYGSSPRVRGTLDRLAGRVRGDRFIPACAGNAHSAPDVAPASGRFIPACAGNARRRSPTWIPTAVHPRVCGERPTPQQVDVRATGSSPRVRGTRSGRLALGVLVRFIPACAGNAPPLGRKTRRSPVHPRVCGERGAATRTRIAGRGSSPRVRGTPGRRLVCAVGRRFIPACAGNAFIGCLVLFGRVGSSPRVRGTRAFGGGQPRPVRFIPACAGNASAEIVTRSSPPGSSPRVRGTRPHCRARPPQGRFIPACAGNAPRS